MNCRGDGQGLREAATIRQPELQVSRPQLKPGWDSRPRWSSQPTPPARRAPAREGLSEQSQAVPAMLASRAVMMAYARLPPRWRTTPRPPASEQRSTLPPRRGERSLTPRHAPCHHQVRRTLVKSTPDTKTARRTRLHLPPLELLATHPLLPTGCAYSALSSSNARRTLGRQVIRRDGRNL